MVEIKESDWKFFRQAHKIALERFCERILDENEELLSDTSRSAHERYIAIYRLFRERDKEVANLFDDFRRSTALWQIAALRGRGLLTDEEFARFSQETQNRIALLLGELM
ncbi:MAG: peptide ABC transporter substrate-binding protein [Chloracidobacterium sp.]|nr:peptide ABC transporter substrate-binding protein [Chloracidobacterium sp.]